MGSGKEDPRSNCKLKQRLSCGTKVLSTKEQTMKAHSSSIRWGAICAIAAGIGFLVPLSFYLYFLPAAGSSATHAQNPASFLPWMASRGGVRVALWWLTSLTFVIVLLGIPHALREVLRDRAPSLAQVAELAGILGSFTLVLASLMLAAGELPLARAYIQAGDAARPAIVATYEWQRLVTALLFDVLGFFLLSVWITASSVAGLLCNRLPKVLGWFGMATGLLTLCFVIGYVAHIRWLGELGIGALSLLAMPAWMIWLGVVLWRAGREIPDATGT
jgi:hypothetical protein